MLYTFRNGDSWLTPRIAVASARVISRARLGARSFGTDSALPLLVWDEADSVFYSTYRAGAWSVPLPVAPGPGISRNPDIVGARQLPNATGAVIIWESTRAGDTAVYGTLPDSFAMALRYSCGMAAEADLLEASIAGALAEGLRTADIMQDGMTQVSTAGMGHGILARLERLA